MKIHYYDFIAAGGVHTTFNSAMIEVLRNVFPESKEIIFHSEKEHGVIVNNKVLSKISIKPMKLLFLCPYKRLRDVFSILIALKTIISVRKNDVICFGLVFPICINAIWFFTKIFRKHVYVCLHGEMQAFLETETQNFSPKIKKYMQIMGFSFHHHNPYVTYILLGQTIYDSVKSLFNEKNKVIILNHPAIFNMQRKPILHRPICIGAIGSALERKNSHVVFELAKILESYIKSGLLKIKIAGYCSKDFDLNDCGLVEYSSALLNEEELQEQINSLDYSLQLTTDSICRAIASGTMIDSLLYDKPILGFHSSYLDYYFLNTSLKKYICSSVEELSVIIKELIMTIDETKYEEDVKQLQEIKKEFSVDVNSILFKKQMILN